MNTYLTQLAAKRADLEATMAKLQDVAAAEQRELTDDEAAAFEALDTEVRELDLKAAPIIDAEKRHTEHAKAIAGVVADTKPEGREAFYGQAGRVRTEERQYNPDAERRGVSFFTDAYQSERFRNPEASERIGRHMRETELEGRDIGTSALSGLVVPQYLLDQAAPLARNGRPFADAIGSLPLPDQGTAFSISRITTGTAVAAQSGENTGIQETNADDTLLTFNLCTIAGMQDLSRQLIERSAMSAPLIARDLSLALATEIDRQLLVGTGTNGELEGVLTLAGTNPVTYTEASPLVSTFYRKLAETVSTIETQRFLEPNLLVMHPRRTANVAAGLDTTGRPYWVPTAQGPMNAVAGGTIVGNTGMSILGLPIVKSANIPTNYGAGTTNQDRVIALNTNDVVFHETPETFLRFDSVGSGTLTVRVVLYKYVAATFGRYPSGIAVVQGTGLAPPSF